MGLLQDDQRLKTPLAVCLKCYALCGARPEQPCGTAALVDLHAGITDRGGPMTMLDAITVSANPGTTGQRNQTQGKKQLCLHWSLQMSDTTPDIYTFWSLTASTASPLLSSTR